MNRPRLIIALTALAAALPLAGCGKSAQPDAAQTQTAAPDAKPGLAVSGGVLVLPAVAGNPGAAYFVLDNTGSSKAALAVISIQGAAKAEMHQTSGGSMMPVDQVQVEPGTSVKFERGALHVMVFQLDPGLKAGGTTEMTLTFSDGDKLSVPLKIETVAAGGDEMAGMTHGDAH